MTLRTALRVVACYCAGRCVSVAARHMLIQAGYVLTLLITPT